MSFYKLVILLFIFFTSVSNAEVKTLFIDNAKVIDTHNLTVSQNDILITDDRIAKMAEKLLQPAQSEYLDASGKFLIPGLTDAHVHLNSIPGLQFGNMQLKNSNLVNLYKKQAPRSYLYFGITQVLDLAGLGQDLDWFESSADHPDVFKCGAAPLIGGYPLVFNDDLINLLPYFIIEEEASLPDAYKFEDHTPQAAVMRISKDKGSCIKIYIEDGFGNASHWPIMSDDTLKRIRKTADKVKLPVFAHANAFDMYAIALDVPFDTLVHGLWSWNQYSKAPGMADEVKHQLDQVHAGQINYMPTLRVIEGLKELFQPETLNNAQMEKAVPGELLKWYASKQGQFFKEMLRNQDFDGLPDSKIQDIFTKNPIARGVRSLQYLNSLGHPMILASDTPSSPIYTNQPGLNSLLEIYAMHNAGVDLGGILQAGTINAAGLINQTQDYGSVEIGKLANLLILNHSPLEKIEAYDSIAHVIKRGKVINRTDLAADQ